MATKELDPITLQVIPAPTLQGFLDAFEIARDRADMERRRFRFTERVELGVEKPGTQILGFADDR